MIIEQQLLHMILAHGLSLIRLQRTTECKAHNCCRTRLSGSFLFRLQVKSQGGVVQYKAITSKVVPLLSQQMATQTIPLAFTFSAMLLVMRTQHK